MRRTGCSNRRLSLGVALDIAGQRGQLVNMERDDVQRPEGSTSPSGTKLDPLTLATLVGVVMVLMVSLVNMRDLRRLGERVATLGTQMASKAEPAAPDPNRVYTIKMAGAPTKGPDTAPVVIAVFSEFQ
jgi:hypothetical protein